MRLYNLAMQNQEKKEEKKKPFACRALWAERPGRCAAALLVLC
jgi:hypothetical protein